MTEEDFLAQAAAHRAAAADTSLANRREMHERSATSWEAMARGAADTAERALVNENAKAQVKKGAV
ncbi:MAG TPA: hypothetical protein VF631_08475 [Allosphingosinicella sp.]|jgi:hypothetical protein|uniref:hypothetical protein n=1 Tax=Allosphingosinicella sp. TaxID=2823234 RepID=UPI002F291068